VNPDLQKLITLQGLELNISVLQTQVSEIPQKSLELENSLQSIKARYEAKVAHTKEIANRRRTLEGEVDLARTRLARLKDQLMAVKTNKEYTAMLHEIRMAEEQIRTEEDKILDLMEKIESGENELKTLEQEMRLQGAEIQKQIRQMSASAPALEGELAKLREEKAAVESGIIDKELLERYRRIAAARKGIALAEAKNELCDVCHVRIRPQMYADLLRTDEIFFCDSCSRILFAVAKTAVPVIEIA